MSDWIDVILFGVVLVVFILGMSSIVMGFMFGKEGSEVFYECIEMGYLGVSGLVVSLLMFYVIG